MIKINIEGFRNPSYTLDIVLHKPSGYNKISTLAFFLRASEQTIYGAAQEIASNYPSERFRVIFWGCCAGRKRISGNLEAIIRSSRKKLKQEDGFYVPNDDVRELASRAPERETKELVYS